MATAKFSQFLRSLTRGMAAEALGDQSDRELVARFLTRQDEAVFEALVRRHGPMVYRVCWRVLQHPQDAEDAFQATFLLLAQKLPTVRKRDSLASWLHGVAHRVALKAQAQAATRRRHQAQASKSQAVLPDEVTWRELRTVLDAELVQLPEKWRLPLILCYLEGRAQEEAAAQLGWSKSTLLRRLGEARGALGRRLTRRGFWPAALAAVLLSDCVASAAPSPGLLGPIAEAAACVAAGNKATAGLISAKVAALAEGVLKSMLLTKLKIAAAALVAACVAAAGAAALTVPVLASGQRAAEYGTTQGPGRRDAAKAKDEGEGDPAPLSKVDRKNEPTDKEPTDLSGVSAPAQTAVPAPTPLAKELAGAKLVVFGMLYNAEGRSTTDVAILAVIKDHEVLKDKKHFSLDRHVPTEGNDPNDYVLGGQVLKRRIEPKYYVLFGDVFKGRIDIYRALECSGKDDRVVEYLRDVGKRGKASPAVRLAFFFEHLEGNPDVAADAFGVFNNTTYAELKGVASLFDRKKLEGRLADKKVPESRKELYRVLSILGQGASDR